MIWRRKGGPTDSHRTVPYGAIDVVASAEQADERDGERRAAKLLRGNSSDGKRRRGCGCLSVIFLLAFGSVYLFSGASSKVADVLNRQFGRVCEARIEGLLSSTLRLDWTAETKVIDSLAVMAAIGGSKETLYSNGVRYLKFPNDSGTYNIIDWKTGEKTSVDERARYYFHR